MTTTAAKPKGPKITAIAPWFGSKRTLAPRIVKELGKHASYFEPLCGSCSVLLAKDLTPFETVNDFHGDLVNLARVLKCEDTAIDLYSRLMPNLMVEKLFHEAAERYRGRGITPATDEPDVDRAADYMTCSWHGRNGVAGTSSYNQGFCIRYTKNGGHAAKRWHSVVASIPEWHERLRNVTILNRDGIDLLGRWEDSPGCVIYCDPPYLVKGAKYVHDFTSDDHNRLAESLKRFRKTRVVVSYYDHPLLTELYPPGRWTKVQCPTTKALVNQGMRDEKGSVKAPEVLLINGPSYTEGGMFK